MIPFILVFCGITSLLLSHLFLVSYFSGNFEPSFLCHMDRILLPYLPLSPLRELCALTFHSSHMSEAFAAQVFFFFFFFLPAHMPLPRAVLAQQLLPWMEYQTVSLCDLRWDCKIWMSTQFPLWAGRVGKEVGMTRLVV